MNLSKLIEKFCLAREEAQKGRPQGGLCGLELEWNLLDEDMQPLLTIGADSSRQSFVDYLRSECLPSGLREFSQLEVFHWMIEWATRPYYLPRAAVYEGRLMEAIQLNALERAGRDSGKNLYGWHGNLPILSPVGYDSIPDSWRLAKRRYLERCIDLYGDSLATAGTHSNLSLPDPLFAWDYLQLSATERGDRHLDEYKSEFYILATRLMRAFCSIFIATSASTPLQAQMGENGPLVRLTESDSVRNLIFPNPIALDLPNLYRSYQDYLQLSYDLARSGVRFGNNNWTPVRARSFAEPVERLIDFTSDQLKELYARGLLSAGDAKTVEEMARQIEIQNLMARINLPMARVEVRTDDGGHPLGVDIANLTFKHLLLIQIYGDPDFARSFRYDREDLVRARRNEESAAHSGLRAEIQNPLTGKPVAMREFLGWTLEQVKPIAVALDLRDDLEPLFEMAGGGSNTAEKLRSQIRDTLEGSDVVPLEMLRFLAKQRKEHVIDAADEIVKSYTRSSSAESDIARLDELMQLTRQAAHLDPQAPIRFRTTPTSSAGMIEPVQTDKTGEILALAQSLIRIPSVTVGAQERLDEVRRAAALIYDFTRDHDLPVHYFDRNKYPALLIGFPPGEEGTGKLDQYPVVTLGGHFDVVSPEPDDSQFEPRVEGEYLWGRGAADMKTVVATFLVWMKDVRQKGGTYPPINLLLVGNEENGETEPDGTPHILSWMEEQKRTEAGQSCTPSLFIAGERTGERGDELWGEICIQNRGVMRFEVIASGTRRHSGTGGASADLSDRLITARSSLKELLEKRLTLHSPDGWQSQVSFPFMQVGTPGIYNITPDFGNLGVEVRPIPQDDIAVLEDELKSWCQVQGLELRTSARENGVACNPDNPGLVKLVEAVRQVSGQQPVIGRKLAGTSARFSPGGQGVVWGQSGVGPHSAEERHYIPSILPYYQALSKFGELIRL